MPQYTALRCLFGTRRQAPQQPESARQRRVRASRGPASDSHSGAGSTTRRGRGVSAGPLEPFAAPAMQANREGSSGQPAAHQAGLLQAAQEAHAEMALLDQELQEYEARAQQRATATAAATAPMPRHHAPQNASLGGTPRTEGVKQEDDEDIGGSSWRGARGRGRGEAAEAGPEPAEDVCCERAQSPHAQDRSAKSAAALPAPVQRGVVEQPSVQGRASQTARNAAAGRSAAAQRAAAEPAAPAPTGGAGVSKAGPLPALRPASPQLAVIQDGTSQSRPRRQPRASQQDRGVPPVDGLQSPLHRNSSDVEIVGASPAPGSAHSEPAPAPAAPPVPARRHEAAPVARSPGVPTPVRIAYPPLHRPPLSNSL